MAKKTETLSESLKILTWNIDARVEEREERLETIARIIKTEQPDVVCLQEVWSGAGSSLAEKLECIYPLNLIFQIANLETLY